MRKYFYLAIFIILMLFLIGCSPKRPSSDPNKVINNYYQFIKDDKYDKAYDLFCNYNKSKVSKEDFVYYEQLLIEIVNLKEFKIMKNAEYLNKNLNNTNYNYIIEYDVTETFIDYANDKNERNITIKGDIVSENGAWKVYIEDGDFKKLISNTLYGIGNMYEHGKGKELKVSEAANYYRKAVTYNPDNPAAYLGLGNTYLKSRLYDEAIDNYKKCIDKITNDQENKSRALCNMGLCYEGKYQYNDARDCYNAAIQADPNNENAKQCLAELK